MLPTAYSTHSGTASPPGGETAPTPTLTPTDHQRGTHEYSDRVGAHRALAAGVAEALDTARALVERGQTRGEVRGVPRVCQATTRVTLRFMSRSLLQMWEG